MEQIGQKLGGRRGFERRADLGDQAPLGVDHRHRRAMRHLVIAARIGFSAERDRIDAFQCTIDLIDRAGDADEVGMELDDIVLQVRPIAVGIDRQKNDHRQTIRPDAQSELGNDLFQVGECERTHVRTIGETGKDERPVTLERVRCERLAVVIVQGEGLHQ